MWTHSLLTGFELRPPDLPLWSSDSLGVAICPNPNGTSTPYEVQVTSAPGTGQLIITGGLSQVSLR